MRWLNKLYTSFQWVWDFSGSKQLPIHWCVMYEVQHVAAKNQKKSHFQKLTMYNCIIFIKRMIYILLDSPTLPLVSCKSFPCARKTPHSQTAFFCWRPGRDVTSSKALVKSLRWKWSQATSRHATKASTPSLQVQSHQDWSRVKIIHFYRGEILLMGEILHHKKHVWNPVDDGIYWYTTNLNWCRISEPSTVYIPSYPFIKPFIINYRSYFTPFLTIVGGPLSGKSKPQFSLGNEWQNRATEN